MDKKEKMKKNKKGVNRFRTLMFGIILSLILIPCVLGETYDTVNSTFYNFTWQGAVLNNNLAISAWVNGPLSVFSPIIRSSTGYSLFIDNNNKLNITFRNDSGHSTFTSTASISTNSWNHVAAIYNGTSVILYVNGVGTASSYSGGYLNGSSWILGLDSTYFNGTIDDVMIFNRSLSAEEIRGLYANQSSRSLGINYTDLRDGVHSFKAYSQDLIGNVNQTETRSVRTDATGPVVSIVYPTNTTYQDIYAYNLSLNVSISDGGVGESKRWWNLNNGMNTTFTGNTTIVGLTNGSNIVKVYTNDTLNNVNSASVTFTLGFTPKIYDINVSNSVTFDSSLARIASLFIRNNQGVVISTLVNRLSGFILNTNQIINLDDIITRFGFFNRATSTAMSWNLVVQKVVYVFRLPSQTFNFNDMLNILLDATRSSNQNIAFTDGVAKWRGITKMTFESFGISDSVSRVYIGARQVVENIVFMFTTVYNLDRFGLEYLANIFDSFTINNFVARTFYGTTIINQNFNIDTLLARLFSGFKIIDNQIGIGTNGSYLRIVTVSPSLQFSIDTLLGRLVDLLRGTSQEVIVNTGLSNELFGTRYTFDSFGISETIDHWFGTSRGLFQSFSIDSMVNTLWSQIRQIDQHIMFSGITERFTVMQRRIGDILHFIVSIFSYFISSTAPAQKPEGSFPMLPNYTAPGNVTLPGKIIDIVKDYKQLIYICMAVLSMLSFLIIVVVYKIKTKKK